MLAEGRPGEIRVASGADRELRLGPYADLIVNDVGLGRYFEAARNGRIFHALATAVTINTAGGVTNPNLALLAPTGGSKAAVILDVWYLPVAVGTFAAYRVQLFGAAGKNGTATPNVTPQNALLGGAASSMQLLAAVTSTFSAAPTLLRDTAIDFPVSPFTAVTSIGMREEIGGSIIVPPGAGFAVSGSAGQGTGTADLGITWAEVDWPL